MKACCTRCGRWYDYQVGDGPHCSEGCRADARLALSPAKPVPRAGDRVRVSALWSEFRGMRGVVVQTVPHCMVLLDGEAHPLRVDAVSLEVLDP